MKNGGVVDPSAPKEFTTNVNSLFSSEAAKANHEMSNLTQEKVQHEAVVLREEGNMNDVMRMCELHGSFVPSFDGTIYREEQSPLAMVANDLATSFLDRFDSLRIGGSHLHDEDTNNFASRNPAPAEKPTGGATDSIEKSTKSSTEPNRRITPIQVIAQTATPANEEERVKENVVQPPVEHVEAQKPKTHAKESINQSPEEKTGPEERVRRRSLPLKPENLSPCISLEDDSFSQSTPESAVDSFESDYSYYDDYEYAWKMEEDYWDQSCYDCFTVDPPIDADFFDDNDDLYYEVGLAEMTFRDDIDKMQDLLWYSAEQVKIRESASDVQVGSTVVPTTPFDHQLIGKTNRNSPSGKRNSLQKDNSLVASQDESHTSNVQVVEFPLHYLLSTSHLIDLPKQCRCEGESLDLSADAFSWKSIDSGPSFFQSVSRESNLVSSRNRKSWSSNNPSRKGSKKATGELEIRSSPTIEESNGSGNESEGVSSRGIPRVIFVPVSNRPPTQKHTDKQRQGSRKRRTRKGRNRSSSSTRGTSVETKEFVRPIAYTGKELDKMAASIEKLEIGNTDNRGQDDIRPRHSRKGGTDIPVSREKRELPSSRRHFTGAEPRADDVIERNVSSVRQKWILPSELKDLSAPTSFNQAGIQNRGVRPSERYNKKVIRTEMERTSRTKSHSKRPRVFLDAAEQPEISTIPEEIFIRI